MWPVNEELVQLSREKSDNLRVEVGKNMRTTNELELTRIFSGYKPQDGTCRR
jgi:hypothetical protein